jgi:hypothetical protein
MGYGTGSGKSVAVADLNADGKIDLVVANYYNSYDRVSVLLNNGDGTFAQVDYDTGVGGGSVAVADLNADGKADLAVANSNSATVSVLLNNGNGTFAPRLDYATGVNPRSVAAADLNGDGKADLAVANYNTVSVLLNQCLP